MNWSLQADEYVVRNYAKLPTEKVAEHLGVTKDQLYSHIGILRHHRVHIPKMMQDESRYEYLRKIADERSIAESDGAKLVDEIISSIGKDPALPHLEDAPEKTGGVRVGIGDVVSVDGRTARIKAIDIVAGIVTVATPGVGTYKVAISALGPAKTAGK